MLPKKKLLILIDWFYPGFKAGGPVQSCLNICKALKNDYEIFVLTTDTDHGEKFPYVNIESNKWISDIQLGVKIFYAKKMGLQSRHLRDQIVNVSADYIYLNHLFSPKFVVYPLWLLKRGLINAKMVVCPRGALYHSALSIKAYKKKPLLKLYKWFQVHKQITFHATNERERMAIKNHFPDSEILVADNLPDSSQVAFQPLKKQVGKLRCIFVARLVPIKNLLFLLNVLKSVSLEEITLTIIGPIEDESYWNECQRFITDELPANITVAYEGAKSQSDLLAYFHSHHLFVLPTKGENFGHSIFEAMLAGRPVLISDQTPWLNLQHFNVGWDLSLAKPDEFAKILIFMANANQSEWEFFAKSSWNYAKNFINNSMAVSQYKTLFSS